MRTGPWTEREEVAEVAHLDREWASAAEGLMGCDPRAVAALVESLRPDRDLRDMDPAGRKVVAALARLALLQVSIDALRRLREDEEGAAP